MAEGDPKSPYRDNIYFVRHVRMSLGIPPVDDEAKFKAWKEQAPARLKDRAETATPEVVKAAPDMAIDDEVTKRGTAKANETLGLNTIEPGLEKKRKKLDGDEETKRAASLQKADEDKTQPRPQQATEKKASDNKVESDEIFTATQADIKPPVPKDIEKQYLRVGGKFYHPKNTDLVAFEDKGNKLETRSNSEHIAESMVRIAEARGWDEIKVSGSETFRREVWLEAASRGMDVKGYSPSEQDKAQLAKRTSERQANNLEKGNKHFRLSENKTDDETTVPRQDTAKAKLSSRADAFRNKPPEEAVKAHPELAGAYATVAALDKKAEVDGLDENQRAIISAKVREFVAANIERGHIPNTKLREEREVVRSRSNEQEYSR